MPRKRLKTTITITSAQDKLAETLADMTYAEAERRGIDMTLPRGRPRKAKVPKALNDATITTVANGYIVRSNSTGTSQFVFEDIDKAFEFIRAGLKPTDEQTEFLKKV